MLFPVTNQDVRKVVVVLLLISSVLGTNQNRPHIIFILADDLVSISMHSGLYNDVSGLKGTLHDTRRYTYVATCTRSVNLLQ